MTLKFPMTKPRYRFCFVALCAIALVGYALPAVKAHLTIHELDVARSFGVGLTTIIDRPESPVDRFALLDGLAELGVGQDDLAELTGDFNLIDAMRDAIRMARLFAALYLAPLSLLLAIAALTVVDKFALAKRVLIVLAFAMFAAAGPVVLAATETALDILTSNLEGFFAADEILGSLAATLGVSDVIHEIVNEALHVELGPGYRITVILLGLMALAEAAMFLKNRFRPAETPNAEGA